MDANTDIVIDEQGNEEDEITSEEFGDRAFALQTRIEELCDKEQHAGVTMFALLNALATNVDASVQANNGDLEETIEQIHTDLDEMLEALKDGTYYKKNYLN